MSVKDSGIRVRVEKSLRDAFVEVCRTQGLPASSVLRDFMCAYAERHQNGLQGNLFLNRKRQKEKSDSEPIDGLPIDKSGMAGRER